jgi:molybdopterin-guanine dinucleotide biosynthesis protein A
VAGDRKTPVRAAILIGGRSERMGAPKATLDLGDGSTPLGRVIAALETAGLPVLLVGETPEGQRAPALECIGDADHAVGPMAGILAALAHDPQAAWVVCACDLPAISPRAIRWLVSQRDREHLAVLPRLGAKGVEPLFALYEPGAAASLRALASTGRHGPSLLALADGVASPEPPSELHAAWTNLNTPEQLAAFVAERLEAL